MTRRLKYIAAAGALALLLVVPVLWLYVTLTALTKASGCQELFDAQVRPIGFTCPAGTLTLETVPGPQPVT